MKVGDARREAAAVVHALRTSIPVEGAYFIGSLAVAPAGIELPATSDLDVMVVVSGTEAPPKPGKVLRGEALIEVSFVAKGQLAPPERAMRDYHIANGLRYDTVLFDAGGWLTGLQKTIARTFTHEAFVAARCQNAREKIESRLGRPGTGASWPQQVTTWLFATGVTTHVLLVAALRNPTVRNRYLAVRTVLRDYGHSPVYQRLLRMLGCDKLTPGRAASHLERLATVFDMAAGASATPFPFSSDITPASRRLAIDAGAELIDQGNHQEAIFWIAATFARCATILAADGTRAQQTEAESFMGYLLADLGISGQADLLNRSEQVLKYLPELAGVAGTIIKANPEIVHGSR